jgi:hypothetical protein
MRVKSLSEPTGILNKGDEWLSPDGHSSTWRRVWNGTTWTEPEAELEEPEDLDETEVDDDTQTTEDPKDEQGMQTAVPDSNGGEQGASGGSSSEPKQRGKRGKVRAGRKGK